MTHQEYRSIHSGVQEEKRMRISDVLIIDYMDNELITSMWKTMDKPVMHEFGLHASTYYEL